MPINQNQEIASTDKKTLFTCRAIPIVSRAGHYRIEIDLQFRGYSFESV